MVPAAKVPMRRLSSTTPRYYRCRTLGCDGEPLIAADVEARVVRFLAALPAAFSAGHRNVGIRHARNWDLLMGVNQRRAVEAVFAFLAWDPTKGRFIAEPTDIDLPAEDAASGQAEPAEAQRPPPPLTFRELLARRDGRT